MRLTLRRDTDVMTKFNEVLTLESIIRVPLQAFMKEGVILKSSLNSLCTKVVATRLGSSVI